MKNLFDIFGGWMERLIVLYAELPILAHFVMAFWPWYIHRDIPYSIGCLLTSLTLRTICQKLETV